MTQSLRKVPLVPSVMTNTTSTTFTDDNPCLSCGACCSHFRVSFYFGELESHDGGWVPVAFTSKINDFRACMQGTESGEGRCVALRGTVGQTGISCSIYASRPSPCREFEAWLEDGMPNPDCQRVRAKHGLPSLPPRAIR